MSSGFVSEADIIERRKVKEELWKAQKSEGDPDEPPDEPIPDYRSLYARLQEQKDKKQEDWDEAHRLKNMVRGLEDDEVDFLEFVDTTKIREERRIKTEEAKALDDYRKKVADLQRQSNLIDPGKVDSNDVRKVLPNSGKTSHKSLLAGAVKRKSSDGEHSQQKKIKPDDSRASESSEGNAELLSASHKSESKDEPELNKNSTKLPQVVAVLPGLGVYTDSSDSECDSSDSEPGGRRGNLLRDLTGRVIRLQEKNC